MVGEGLGQGGFVLGVVRAERDEPRLVAAGSFHPAHGDRRRRQTAPDRRDDALGVGPASVDLVDEDQRRHADAPKRAEQQRGLGLDALDRRDDQHRTIEDAEDTFHLGDEVGVAGCVDEVDRQIADLERGDRGPDRDAAFALEIERVGLGGAGVDAADAIDGAGGEEETLGEGGLTGVDVREDAEIERSHGASCLPRR